MKRAAPAGAAGSRGPCWAWSKPEGCSFGKAGAYSHSPAKKYRAGDGGSGSGRNGGGGSGGSISRGGGNGSGGGTSSGGSSTRVGAGTRSGVRFSAASTAASGSGWRRGLRRQTGPTLVTTRSLPSERIYARERSGSAVQSQPGVNLGGGGVGLITDVVASSTSADQLRTRLGERMSRVADLGTRFAG